jgi:hypothetical protein
MGVVARRRHLMIQALVTVRIGAVFRKKARDLSLRQDVGRLVGG